MSKSPSCSYLILLLPTVGIASQSYPRPWGGFAARIKQFATLTQQQASGIELAALAEERGKPGGCV